MSSAGGGDRWYNTRVETTFTTVIRGIGNNTGIEVPEQNLAELGAGKRPPVTVVVGDYSYSGSVGAMGGLALVSLSRAHREASGLGAGDAVTVTLRLVEGERVVEVPEDLAEALGSAGRREAFDGLSYSVRKEHARSVVDAKTPETRARRVAKVLERLPAR